MTLRKTRDPNDGFFESNSNRRGGGEGASRTSLKSSLKSSLRWSFLAGSYSSGASRGSSSGGRAGGRGRSGGMAAAAAAVASSYGEGIGGERRRSSYGDGISDAHLDGSARDPYAPSSFQHDVSDASRDSIDDAIEVVFGKDAEEVPAEVPNKTAASGGRPWMKSAAVIATAGILLVASAAVAYFGVLALNGDDPRGITNPFASKSGDAPDRETGAHLQTGSAEEHLLEIAEQVVSACDETRLDEDMSDCLSLCHRRLCCFENRWEYRCRGDEMKDCAVYAGCEALMTGVGGGGDDSNVPPKKEVGRFRWG